MRTIAIVVHHTVTPPLLSWFAVAANHVDTRRWAGISYHLGIDYDGTINLLGDLDSHRAHVQGRNHELVGVALMGDFSLELPPPAQLDGLRQALDWLRSGPYYGTIPVLGHREAALPDGPTSCPGDALMAWLKEVRGD